MAAVLFCAIRIVYVTGGDVNGLVRAVVGGAPYPGADNRDVHGVEQLGEPLDELAIVAAELDVKDVDGVGQGVGQELADGPVGQPAGSRRGRNWVLVQQVNVSSDSLSTDGVGLHRLSGYAITDLR